MLIWTRRTHVADTIRLVEWTRLIRLDRLAGLALARSQRHLREARHCRKPHIL